MCLGGPPGEGAGLLPRSWEVRVLPQAFGNGNPESTSFCAPGVPVGEGRQPFELEVRGSIPLGSTRNQRRVSGEGLRRFAVSISPPCTGVDSCCGVAVEMERSFSPLGTGPTAHIALSVCRPRPSVATVESGRCFARNSQVQILSVARPSRTSRTKEARGCFRHRIPPRLFSGRQYSSRGRRAGGVLRLRSRRSGFKSRRWNPSPPWCNLGARCCGSSSVPATSMSL